MSNVYALIEPPEPGGRVVGLSALAAEVNVPGLVPVQEYDQSLIGQLWDGENFAPDPNPPAVPEDTDAAVRLAQKAAAIRDLPDTIRFLDSAERGEASKLFPEWRAGVAVADGEVYRFEGEAYRVIQAHTTQADWTPPAVPALFGVL